MVEASFPLELELPTERGPLRVAYHPLPNASGAVACVGGFDGGFDGPAERLYADLPNDFATLGLATLRVDFRTKSATGPGNVEEGVFDLSAAVDFLTSEGIEAVGLLGHSFGGAVVIATAAARPQVASVVTLASQTAGAQPVVSLAPRPILLVHGLADIRLLPDCSRLLYQWAGEPKRLELIEGATHSLRQAREQVRTLVVDWFRETLPTR